MNAEYPPSLEAAMRIAVRAGEHVWGRTSPNPPVGAVVLDADGGVVGVGETQPPPGAHAEVVALREAGESARGGTVLVTLEPCTHYGRTPPCVDALIAAGVHRVVYAVNDPTRAASGGAEALRAAGIAVRSGVLSGEVRAGALRAWTHLARTARCHVTWKYAASLDGRSAAADGSSQWISSRQARAEVHRIRARVDAVVVGTGTVLADDPQLTARDEHGQLLEHQPLRVVVGERELPAHARVFDDAAPTLRLRSRDPQVVLDELTPRGVVDVLLEGGPSLAGAFLAVGCVDRVVAYVAPKLLGQGSAALGTAGVSTIEEAIPLHLEDVGRCGQDVRIEASVQRAK